MSELIDLTERLLASIADGDWETYTELCDPRLTAFEPEACGHLVEGMQFHRFYFEQENEPRSQTTLINPHVRVLGDDVAVVCYNRIVQRIGDGDVPESHCFEETRVWQRQQGAWKHVHFHRS